MNISEARNNLVLQHANPKTAFLRNIESVLGWSGYLDKEKTKDFRRNVAPAIIMLLDKYEKMNNEYEMHSSEFIETVAHLHAITLRRLNR